MWRSASQCLWCAIGLIHAEDAVLQRTSVTTSSMSLGPRVQLLQLKLCMIDMRSCQTSWALVTRIMEAVWTMIPVPFQVDDPVLRGTFGTRCGERKGNVFDRGGITWLWKTACYLVCLVLLSETVTPKPFLLKYSDARWFHRKGSLFMVIQRKHNLLGDTWRIFIYNHIYIFIHIYSMYSYKIVWFNWFGANFKLIWLKKCRRISMEKRFEMVSLQNQKQSMITLLFLLVSGVSEWLSPHTTFL